MALATLGGRTVDMQWSNAFVEFKHTALLNIHYTASVYRALERLKNNYCLCVLLIKISLESASIYHSLNYVRE